MNPLARLAVCVGRMLAHVEMLFPGIDDDALEETPLVEAEAEAEVHEPAPRTADSLGIDERDAVWKSVVGTLWRWNENRWWHSEIPDVWVTAPYDYWPQSTGPYIAVDPEAPELDWHGWAVPAILEVLAENEFDDHYAIDTDDRSQWAEHVAPIIADRIACDPERALNALYTLRNDRLHR